jgi:LysR family transcriptional regulator, nitrogen assimilation regulatory protein
MGRSRIQLRQLDYFINIVDAGSFSRAASTIHVAQPALSQQMGELEASLGVSLLHRSARGVQPTSAGKLLYAEAKAIIDRMEHLPDVVRSSGEDIQGVVRIGMSSVLASFMANAIKGACKAALPNVTLHFVSATSEQLSNRVRDNSLDIAVIFEGKFVSGVVSKALFEQRLFVVMQRARQFDHDHVTWDSLRNMPLILPARPHDTIARMLLEPLFSDWRAAAAITIEDDLSATLSAVQAGLGNAILAMGDLSAVKGGAEMKAIPLEPPLYLTAILITPAEPSLAPAADATSHVILNLITRHLEDQKIAGAIPASV